VRCELFTWRRGLLSILARRNLHQRLGMSTREVHDHEETSELAPGTSTTMLSTSPIPFPRKEKDNLMAAASHHASEFVLLLALRGEK
jgi:hypothetical protein